VAQTLLFSADGGDIASVDGGRVDGVPLDCGGVAAQRLRQNRDRSQFGELVQACRAVRHEC